MNAFIVSEFSSSWGWPVAAAIGGIIVFAGLLLERIGEWKKEGFGCEFFQKYNCLEWAGWTILMAGITAEIIVGFAMAWKEEKDIDAAKNAALTANISDISATVIFFVKEKQFNELTNFENDVSKQVATMYLMNNKNDMGSPFDPLTSDNFIRKGGAMIGEPNGRDNRRYDLRFHLETWGVFMGVERPVKSIADLHWIRLDVNFLPSGSVISDGGIDLVVNNAHKLFHIFPQSETNPPDGMIFGTTVVPYRIFATNVDDAPLP